MNVKRGVAAALLAAMTTVGIGATVAAADDNPSKSDRGGNAEQKKEDRGPDHGPGHK